MNTSVAELPASWRRAELGQIARLGSGGTPKSGNAKFYGGALPWAVIGDLNDGLVSSTASSITDEGLASSSAKLVEPGTVLVAMYGSIGKLGIAGKQMATNQAIAFAVPHDEVMSGSFLFHYLRSQRDVLGRAGKGATQQNISQTILRSWPVPLPSLEEQERIVELLEEHLSRLDAALASIRTVRNRAAQFRRSLLQAVFSGDERLLGKRHPSWISRPLVDVLEVSIGGVWGEEPGAAEVDVDVIRVTELKAHGLIAPATAARRSITHKQLASRSLREGDLLLEKSGGGPNTPVGRVGRVPPLDGDAVCSNFMMLMRADPAMADERYLHLYLGHLHDIGGTIPLQTASTNIRNIKTKEYLQLPVPLPDVDQQSRAVLVLEAHLSHLDTALAVADRAEAQCAALRRSVLHAAFTGKLTEEWREAVHV